MKIDKLITISVEDLRKVLDGLEDWDELEVRGDSQNSIEVYKYLERDEYEYSGYINLIAGRFVKDA